jgi:hypothetical protein
VIAHRLRNIAVSWRAYRAWNRACLLNAWRATRHHFDRGWHSVMEVLGPGLATSLALYMSGAADSVRDNSVIVAAGVATSVLWVVSVLCWNFGLAPYRLWRAARERIAHLQMSIGRRIDRQAIARDLELCIREGTALMDSATPSKSQLSQWYEGVLRVVSRAGHRDRAMLENLGPAPGTRGGALELLILSNRIEKLRLIRDRQHRAAREQALRMGAGGGRQSTRLGQSRAAAQRSGAIRAPRTAMIATSRRR